MMFVIKVSVIFLLVNVIFLKCETARIYFSNCGRGGFSCILQNGKYNITYQCPLNEQDATFFLWNFRAPSNTDSLLIKNCSTLRLSFQCSRENKPINRLSVINITNLLIVESTFTHNPPTIEFENILNLAYIPENTFSQIKRKISSNRECINPAKDFQNLHFNKVTIGIVAPKAFNGLKDFSNFSWNEVSVKRLQHLALELEFNKFGNFSIHKSNLEVVEHMAFKIIGPTAQFVKNKFVDILSSAINGTIETFIFNANSVNNLQSYGISILSEKVYISDNRFEYLEAGAFEKISPGLLENSQRNFGSLKFIYEFNNNFINYMDAASLNPDMQAYDNVATELQFHHNVLFCSCENLGWLFSRLGYGYKTALLQDFYETISEEDYKNICAYTSCNLSLVAAKQLIEGGKCIENKNAEHLCNLEAETTINSIKLTTSKRISISGSSKNHSLKIWFLITFIIIGIV